MGQVGISTKHKLKIFNLPKSSLLVYSWYGDNKHCYAPMTPMYCKKRYDAVLQRLVWSHQSITVLTYPCQFALADFWRGGFFLDASQSHNLKKFIFLSWHTFIFKRHHCENGLVRGWQLRVQNLGNLQFYNMRCIMLLQNIECLAISQYCISRYM